MENRTPSRRSILQALSISGLAFAIPGIASCADDAANKPAASPNSTPVDGDNNAGTVKIVNLVPTSGIQAEVGAEINTGIQHWLSKVDYQVGDTQIDFTQHDSEGQVDTAIRRAREEMDSGARILMGGALSNVALALGEEVNRSQGIFITAAGADEITGNECREGVFRTHVATYGAINATVRPIIEQNPHLQRWYTITPDYAFGYDLLDACEDVFADLGVEHAGNSFHALDVTEFSSYLNNAAASDADVICVLNFAAQATTTIQQAASFGMTSNIQFVVPWSNGLTQFKALGPSILENVYFGSQYWHTIDTPANQDFVESFKAEHGEPPGMLEAAGYTWAKVITEALADADPNDIGAIVSNLESLDMEWLSGREYIRPEDHQLVKGYFLLRGRSEAEMDDPDDYMEILSVDDSVRPLESVQCELTPLGE